MKYTSSLCLEGQKLSETPPPLYKIDLLRIGIIIFWGYNGFMTDFSDFGFLLVFKKNDDEFGGVPVTIES
jgi:hypothetical protein